jgi:hypothetical protein
MGNCRLALAGRLVLRGLAFASCAIALAGCGGRFGETHYFTILDANTNKPINFFRLSVSGGAGLANARYVSGYFDERAVDLFLNESKAAPRATNSDGAVPSIFKEVDCTGMDAAACAAAQEKQLHLVPLGEKMPADGAFVLILSTNADAIAGTIGSFAENEITLNSALFLLNRDRIVQASKVQAAKPVVDASRTATVTEVSALLDAAKTPTKPADLATSYLAVLRAAGAGLGGGPPNFNDEASARAWFGAHRGSAGQ